jgi:hypothetical protein
METIDFGNYEFFGIKFYDPDTFKYKIVMFKFDK